MNVPKLQWERKDQLWWKWVRPAAVGCLLLGASVPLSGKSIQGKSALLVVNQGDATVSVVNPDSLQVTMTIHENVLGMVGHEIEVSPDGHFAYLPLYGDSGLGRPGSDGDTILRLDLQNGTVFDKFNFKSGVRPHRALRHGHLLYVTTELLDAVSVIDTDKWQFVGSIPTGAEQSHMLVLSSDGRLAYTANVSTGTVSVLDLDARSLVRKLQVAPSIQRISISPDDRVLVTADQAAPRLALIDTRSLTVEHWMTLPSIGYGSTFTADGKTLLLTLPQSGQIAIIDLVSRSVRKVIDVGPRPQEVLLRPGGRIAYVSCFGGNYVAVVNLDTYSVTGKIETGQKADGMAWVQAAQ